MFVSSRYVAFFLLLEHLLYQSVNLYLDDARYIPFFWSIQSHQSHQSHRSNMQSHLHPTGRIFLCSIFPLTFSWYQRFSCTESFKQLSLLFKNEWLIDGLSYHTRILHFLATKICFLVGVQKGIINQ